MLTKFCSMLVHRRGSWPNVNPYLAKLNYIIFHPLEVVSRYHDSQLQVAENYSYLFIL